MHLKILLEMFLTVQKFHIGYDFTQDAAISFYQATIQDLHTE